MGSSLTDILTLLKLNSYLEKPMNDLFKEIDSVGEDIDNGLTTGLKELSFILTPLSVIKFLLGL